MPKINADYDGSSTLGLLSFMDSHQFSLPLNPIPELSAITNVRIELRKLLDTQGNGTVQSPGALAGWDTENVISNNTSRETQITNDQALYASARFVPTQSAGRMLWKFFARIPSSDVLSNNLFCQIVEEANVGGIGPFGPPVPVHNTMGNFQYNYTSKYDNSGIGIAIPFTNLQVSDTPNSGENACWVEFEFQGSLTLNKPYWLKLTTTSGGANSSVYVNIPSNSTMLSSSYYWQKCLSSAGVAGMGNGNGMTAWDPYTGNAYPFTSDNGLNQTFSFVDFPTFIIARKNGRNNQILVAVPCSANSSFDTAKRMDYTMSISYFE